MLKRILSFIILVVLLISYHSFNIFAGMDTDNVLKFEKDGSLVMTTTDKKATTGTRYKTIGWTIFNADRSKSVVIQFEEYKSDDLSNGYVKTYYKTEANVIFNRIGNVDKTWQSDLYKNGGNLIFDGAMTIVENGTRKGGLTDNGVNHWGEIYFTYDGIEHAREWQQPDGLDSHFNKVVYLDPHPEMLAGYATVKHFLMDGTPISQYDYSEVLNSGNTYYYTPTGIIGHQYKGYKVGYGSEHSSVMQTTGEIKFTYSGSFSDAYIYFYYDKVQNKNTNGDLEPSLSGFIKADNRGSEKFDVTKGIPSSEDLYVNVFAKNYLYSSAFSEKTGSKSYQVSVTRTYNLSWLEDCGHSVTDGESSYWVPLWVNMSDTQTVTKTYTIVREFSYWVINNLDVYGLNKAVVNNYALPGGTITMQPQNYSLPVLDTWHSDSENDHIKEPVVSNLTLTAMPLNGGTAGKTSIPNENFLSNANNSVEQIKVKNDRLKFNDSLVMSDSTFARDSQDPDKIPANSTIGNDVFYVSGLNIDSNKENKLCPSGGTVYYKRIDGSVNPTAAAEVSSSINNLNSVTIHTPVVCTASVWNDIAYNQMMNPDTSRASLILDRQFKVQLITKGQHKDILGYGNRDYKSYTKDKQVKFPFDVYLGANRGGSFIPAGTWSSIPLNNETAEFYLPTWIDEGNYDVDFREIAINDSDLTKTQDMANIDMSNYIATKTIPVQVSGRLFGFKITDISDYPLWQNVFRAGSDTTKHSDNYYWVGTKDENGNDKGISPQLTLPLLEGSHTQLKNIGAVKTGYKFKYELQTIGNYYNDYDCLDITPKFYFIDKNGNNRQEVDLYYSERFNDKDNYFVKVGSDTDRNNTKYIKFGDVYRNVPDIEIKDTSSILGINENTFRNQDSKIGWFSNEILSKSLRTFIGDNTNIPDGVNSVKVKKSEQKWYGEYYLPNDLFIAQKNFDVNEYSRTNNGLDGSESFWMRDGYVIVNFQINAVKNKEFSNPFLGYWNAPNCNMWQVEGFNYNKTDNNGVTFNLSNGDIVFYYADKKASDDYRGGGTH